MGKMQIKCVQVTPSLKWLLKN